MKTLDEFIKLQQSECRKNMGNLWRPMFGEWLKLLLQETAKATVEACRQEKIPVSPETEYAQGVNIGYEACIDEYERKAKAWLGEEGK